MIGMTDPDVQDIRDLLAKQNAEYEKMNTALDRMYYLASRPNEITAEDRELFVFLKDHESMVAFVEESKAHAATMNPHLYKSKTESWSYL